MITARPPYIPDDDRCDDCGSSDRCKPGCSVMPETREPEPEPEPEPEWEGGDS